MARISMQNITMYSFIMGFSLFGVACATSSVNSGATLPSNAVVILRDNNQYQATAVGSTKIASYQDAINGAYNTCAKQASTAIVVNEKTEYKGVLSENMGQIVKDVSNTVQILTGKKVKNAVGQSDYETIVQFRCKAL